MERKLIRALGVLSALAALNRPKPNLRRLIGGACYGI